MSVQRLQSSVQAGQNATYQVTVSTVNAPAAGVSVTLASQPFGPPAFTSGCNGVSSCTISYVSDIHPVALDARVAVPANAASGSSVQLTATAKVATSGSWTPPTAAETTSVSTASSSPSPSKSPGTSPSGSPGQGKTPAPLPSSPVGVELPPPGPVPALNNASSSLIGPGNAAGLFPPIGPSATPNPAAGVQAAGSRQNPGAVSSASPVALGAPVLTAQVAGLIALALALLLTMTRRSLRRRSGTKGEGS